MWTYASTWGATAASGRSEGKRGTEAASTTEEPGPADQLGGAGGCPAGPGETAEEEEESAGLEAAAELGREEAFGEGHGGDQSGVLLVDKRSVRRADSAPPGKRIAAAEANVSASGNSEAVLRTCGSEGWCRQ